MSKTHGIEYYEMFEELMVFSCRTAQELSKYLHDFDPTKLHERMEALHVIEHTADERMHQIKEKLLKEFITPIEREDILSMTMQLDNVTDSLEDVLIKMYMYCVNELKPEALQFMDIIEESCSALNTTIKEFKHFRKSKKIYESIIEVNRLEETGDKLYSSAVRSLYETCKDPVEVLKWTEVYAQLERCCDACEITANLVEEVIMKNS